MSKHGGISRFCTSCGAALDARGAELPDPVPVPSTATLINAPAVATLQLMFGSTQAASLSYLQAVQQSNATATLELATLSTAVGNLLSVPAPARRSADTGDKSKKTDDISNPNYNLRDVGNTNISSLPPGYPVVT